MWNDKETGARLVPRFRVAVRTTLGFLFGVDLCVRTIKRTVRVHRDVLCSLLCEDSFLVIPVEL